MTRKYSALEEQWKLLDREYHAQDGDQADKDYFVQQRINSLKKWKTEALLQLRFLFNKLKMAVPETEYEEVKRQLNVMTLRNNTQQERNIRHVSTNLELRKKINMNQEAEMNLQLNTISMHNLEMELEILTKRLERHDPIFKWENQIFKKIAQVFMRAEVRPEQAFVEFD